MTWRQPLVFWRPDLPAAAVEDFGRDAANARAKGRVGLPRLLTAMAGLLAALLLLGGAFRPDAAAPPPDRPAAEVGHIAPHFALPGLDGQAVDLADNRGQVVVVAFWATWCPPCAYEMVELQNCMLRARPRSSPST